MAGAGPVRSAGLDLVDVDRLRLALDRSGPRLLDRLFDDRERAACGDGLDAVAMAGLFGIKESVVKALGGLPPGAAYRDIHIDPDGAGSADGRALLVALDGALGAYAAAEGIGGEGIGAEDVGDRIVAGTAAAAPGLVASWVAVGAGGVGTGAAGAGGAGAGGRPC